MPGQTEARGDANFDLVGDSPDDDFLKREEAILGDDAKQFAQPGDRLATVEDDDDDLLGGGGSNNFQANIGGDDTGFESSFPALDTTNDVG